MRYLVTTTLGAAALAVFVIGFGNVRMQGRGVVPGGRLQISAVDAAGEPVDGMTVAIYRRDPTDLDAKERFAALEVMPLAPDAQTVQPGVFPWKRYVDNEGLPFSGGTAEIGLMELPFSTETRSYLFGTWSTQTGGPPELFIAVRLADGREQVFPYRDVVNSDVAQVVNEHVTVFPLSIVFP